MTSLKKTGDGVYEVWLERPTYSRIPRKQLGWAIRNEGGARTWRAVTMSGRRLAETLPTRQAAVNLLYRDA